MIIKIKCLQSQVWAKKKEDHKQNYGSYILSFYFIIVV